MANKFLEKQINKDHKYDLLRVCKVCLKPESGEKCTHCGSVEFTGSFTQYTFRQWGFYMKYKASVEVDYDRRKPWDFNDITGTLPFYARFGTTGTDGHSGTAAGHRGYENNNRYGEKPWKQSWKSHFNT